MTINVSTASLDWALRHIERFGDTGIFPNPFEFTAIRHNWDEIRAQLSSTDLDNWPVRVLRECVAPKGRYSYRIVTQLDPIDLLLYSALVHEVGMDLENYRLPANQDIVFSHRFDPDDNGRMYNSNYTYGAFLNRCNELSEDGSFNHVVVIDISDFFPRLYHHRIESAFQSSGANTDKCRGILKLLKGWTELVSYGIPIGPTASGLIAEITINDIDEWLVSTGAKYCRYVDDFRIFCRSHAEAYKILESLAYVLHHNHGLSLQSGKTEIIQIPAFKRKYLQTPFKIELKSLQERYQDFLGILGLDDPYEEINYDDLDEEQQEAIDSLNLVDLLEQQFSQEVIDASLFRFILRRLGQLNRKRAIPMIFNNIDKCYSVIPSVVSYIRSLRDIDSRQSKYIGEKLINLINNSFVSNLPFHRCWLLSIFSDSTLFGQNNIMAQLFNRFSDQFTQRKLILALGRHRQQYWFRSMRSDVMQWSPWARRAFIAASSCMAQEEARFWYSSINRRVDDLEKSIIMCARNSVFY